MLNIVADTATSTEGYFHYYTTAFTKVLYVSLGKLHMTGSYLYFCFADWEPGSVEFSKFSCRDFPHKKSIVQTGDQVLPLTFGFLQLPAP